MNSEPVPVPVRDLLWRLPELLEGPEPVLSRPKVREYLKSDPDAAMAIAVVAEMSRTMREASALLRSRPPAGRRSPALAIETARRCFRKQLVDLLFELGIVEFWRATQQAGVPFFSDALRDVPATKPPAEDVLPRIADVLGMNLASIWPAQEAGGPLPEVLRAGESPSLAHAERLMNACDALIPDLPGVRFFRLLIPQLQGRPVLPSAWLDFVRTADGAFDKHAALIQAGHLLFLAGDLRASVQANELALRHCPSSPFPPYFIALYGALAGEEAALADRLCRWSECIRASSSLLLAAVTQVRHDRLLWKRLAVRSAKPASHALSRLPPAIANALDEVLR
ncbi:MAG: hypothetical protein HY812_17250 [Planctomycetes bacterium]|nr:hypothetical protein [Planctomycetota bacterium]